MGKKSKLKELIEETLADIEKLELEVAAKKMMVKTMKMKEERE